MVLNNKGKITSPKEIRLVWDNTARVYHQNKLTHPHSKRNFVPATVLTKSGQVPVNAAKQSFHKALASVSAARPVNTVASRPNVNNEFPTTYSYFKAHSLVRRPFNQKSAAKTNIFNEKVNTTKVNNVTTAGPKAVVSAVEGNKNNGNPQYALQDQGIFDSGCSRHMTGNKSYLTDYQEINGGFVAFGRNAKGGKIIGKEVRFAITNDGTGGSKSGKERFQKFANNSGVIGNQTNGNAGTKANIDAGKARKKIILDSQYVFLPLLTSDSLAKEGDKNNQENDLRGQEEAFRKQLEQESKRLFSQGAANTNNTNRLNTVSSLVNAVSSSFTTADPGKERAQRNKFESVFGQDKDANGNMIFTLVSAGGSNYVNLGGLILVNAATLPNDDIPTDHIMHDLKDTADLQDTRIFSGAYDDEVEGVEADFNNLKLTTFVYRNKKDERGIVVRNNARSVVQGYTQEEGINYDKVFDLVARIEAIRIFLAYASYMGFIVYQVDVKSAFLYGIIVEEVYLCQPPGFEDPHFLDKVYKVYIDDIIFGSTKKSLCTEFEGLMYKKFQMSSMGELTFFLGLQVMQRDDGIFISQDKYVTDILKKFAFSSLKTSSTPIESNKALLKDEEAEDMDVHLYRSMIRTLMYLTAFKPDIMSAVCACIENQMDHKVKTIRCDNKTEFKNRIMNEFCEMKGIRREFSVAKTSQQNGLAERKNRSLIEAARTMLVDSKLPTTFWAEAVNTACYV
uniref:Ribonuclease H-like domain, reverse transcriptase, RNA-dependent DNA polymerase n=1 Tax=Tanacetum cinerariifolium TaxID=118510 RepID=A0A6L2PBQ5_TANCI|nr:ribonuclease H-like domain, reverse transcriptase, RNA-dependent DNA polymerase [Tanacetum cinerariifolium]